MKRWMSGRARLVVGLVLLSCGGLWPLQRHGAPRRERQTKTSKPTGNSRGMKWNNSTWMAVSKPINEINWLMMEWIELVSLNGGALRPRSSGMNKEWNDLWMKQLRVACRPKAKQTNQFHQSSHFMALNEMWNDWLELIDLMNGNKLFHSPINQRKLKKFSFHLNWFGDCERYYNSKLVREDL